MKIFFIIAVLFTTNGDAHISVLDDVQGEGITFDDCMDAAIGGYDPLEYPHLTCIDVTPE